MDPQPAPVRNLPKTIGRYEITGRLGKGAMGVVYAARDSMMERTVAIKVMMTDLEDDPDTSARFYREARSAGQLVHPNIVTIFDMGQDNGRPFIVMEYLEGETLNKFMARPDAAPVETKLDLMIQICDGLRAAHARGIYHRDIKPGNLLVRPNGELKIVDFGIARLASSSMTASGLIVGTPDYMSPEQARGENADHRSDIFSAGAVFYYMLTGRKPFAASELTAVLVKVQREDPLPLRDTEAPEVLARIVLKALAKDPADRFQSCAQMIAELEHLRRHLTEETRNWIEDGGRRLRALESVLAECRTLAGVLDLSPAPPDLEAPRHALLEKYATLEEPYPREPAAAFIEEVKGLEAEATAQRARWQQASHALEEARRALGANRTSEAVKHLEKALEIEPGARAASHELDRSRVRAANRRADSDRAAALVDEARKAAAAKQWQAAVALCDEALAVDPESADAGTVKRKASEAFNAEAQRAGVEYARAVERAEHLRETKRFDEAAKELARAREINPAGAGLEDAAARLRAAVADAQQAAAVSREVAEAIAAARSRFSTGARADAIAELRAFRARVPDPGVDAEITRLEGEARRIEADEQRLARAVADSTAAEAALAAGDPRSALDLAKRALAADPTQLLAQKVAGRAAAELKQRAEQEARLAAAKRHIADAKEQLARGGFAKARKSISTAAELDPDNAEHKSVLAQIQEAEKRAAEAEEQERLARQRARAVAPMLARARASEADGDYERALWTAQNALAVDPDCAEAADILRRAEAKLAADPKLSDETVDLGAGAADPEDTVSMTRPLGLWERVTDALRSIGPGRGGRPAEPPARSERMKT